MNNAEKIYHAHHDLGVSFSTIAYLLECDVTAVRNVYHGYATSLHNHDHLTIDDKIEKLGMSVRTTNLLKRHGVYTIKDMMGKSINDFAKIKNLGQKSLVEIEDACNTIGDAFQTIENLDWANTPLAKRTLNLLKRNGIKLVSEITTKIRGFGNATTKELYDTLARSGR